MSPPPGRGLFPRFPMRLRRALVGLTLVAAGTGCGQTTIIKTVATTTAAKPAASDAPASAAVRSSDAHLGDLLTLTAHDTTLKVRATRVMDPLPAGDYDAPDAGD